VSILSVRTNLHFVDVHIVLAIVATLEPEVDPVAPVDESWIDFSLDEDHDDDRSVGLDGLLLRLLSISPRSL
jgi:hypothetical protein